jgi:hypothetical protein
VIADGGPTDPGNLDLRLGLRIAWKIFVCAQTNQRVARQLGVVRRRPPDQLQEQRQRPRCVR